MTHDLNTKKENLPSKITRGGWDHYKPASVPDVEDFDPDSFNNDNTPHVPIQLWGMDHWSTLGYIEYVDRSRQGEIDNAKMQCDENLHMRFSQSKVPGRSVSGSGYPTRLQGDIEILPHDDWSCLEDMAAHDLVHVFIKNRGTTSYQARAFLTKKGRVLANQLLTHKGEGKNWAEFTPDLDTLEDESTSLPEKVSDILND